MSTANATTPAPPAKAAAPAQSAWQAFVEKQKRNVMRLKVTREGRILIGMALAVGFAALNTGNNLLFFGWGLLLASILISGILSETTLRPVQVKLRQLFDTDCQQAVPVDLEVHNKSTRIPAFGVDVAAHFALTRWPDSVDDTEEAHTLFQLKLTPQELRQEAGSFMPSRRGIYRLQKLTATTAYPFGFFEKTKRLDVRRQELVHVGPTVVDVRHAKRALAHRLGGTPSRRVGVGEDFFSLRPFRDGDDLRQVAWRVSARTGRWAVKETEAFSTREVVLVVSPPALPPVVDAPKRRWRHRLPFLGGRLWKAQLKQHDAHPGHQRRVRVERQAEYALSGAYSLALELLRDDHAVGLVAPGLSVLPSRGPRHVDALRHGLAGVDLDDIAPLGVLSARNALVVGVSCEGVPAPGDVDDVVELSVPDEFEVGRVDEGRLS